MSDEDYTIFTEALVKASKEVFGRDCISCLWCIPGYKNFSLTPLDAYPIGCGLHQKNFKEPICCRSYRYGFRDDKPGKKHFHIPWSDEPLTIEELELEEEPYEWSFPDYDNLAEDEGWKDD